MARLFPGRGGKLTGRETAPLKRELAWVTEERIVKHLTPDLGGVMRVQA
ncbi:MAG TPA: hypothetical protein VJ746_05045 [Nitrospira sp.]|nr:hypothetical protein [Nitrospira sp.]